MKGIIITIVIAFLSIPLASTADAQILNRMKDKAKKAAQDKVEEKVANEVEKAAERAVEKSWNSIFGDGFGEEGDGINIPFTLNSSAEIEDVYNFQVSTTMEVETVEKNGKSDGPMIMKMHFNENELYSGTRFSGEQMEMEETNEDVFIIYDLKNESMVMLMENEDGKFSFAYDWRHAQQLAKEFEEMDSSEPESESGLGEEEIEEEWQNFENIGTKTIAGFECDGYRTESDDIVMDYWVTQDEDFGIFKMLRTNEQTKQLKGKVPEDYPAGMLMEMVQKNTTSGEVTTMRVTDVDKNANVTYNMSDYPAMSIGSQQ